MALRLVMGPSGSGKTYFLYKYALEEADKHPERNYIIIVPEQFTLSTQKDLIRLSKRHGILNVDVLSFNRLAYRIFEEIGFKDLSGSALDDMGKNLILRHAGSKINKELTVFSDNINRLGYITGVKSAISEFMQYGISIDKLNEMAEQSEKAGKTLLSQKLKDISKLYAEFNDFIKNKYITTEEVLTKAASAAYKSKKLQQSVILFDGFTGFTPVQYDLIESLLKITIDMHFTILTDTRDIYDYNKEHELFYLGFQTKNKLYTTARNNNIRIENEIVIRDEVPKRFSEDVKLNNTSENNASELIHLERNIFRNNPKRYVASEKNEEKPTSTVNDGIVLISSLNPLEEVIRIAAEIQKIVQSGEEIRYRDIAIATADIENYIPHFKRVFELYNIPYFIDRSQPALLNPFVEFFRALVVIITDDFSYNAVLRLLRSPILSYEKSEIDMLDNFILAKGVKGYKAWTTGFEEKYGCNLKIKKQFDLNTLDIIRAKTLEILSPLENLITAEGKKIRKKPTMTVNEINQAFIRVFELLDIEKRLNELADQYSITDDSFDNNHRYEFDGIFKNTIALLDKMSELLGDEIISLEEYGELLDAGFDEIRIGIIPKITDYIQIGDTTRSRFNDIHTLFIAGANDGNIPASNSTSGVISDIEKEFLLENIPGIELAPTARVKAYTCQLYLYMLMTKPKSRLYVSFSRLNNNSESIRPSYIIKVLTDMFPSLSVLDDSASRLELVYDWHGIYDVLSDNIRDDEYSDLIRLILGDSSAKEHDADKIKRIIDCAFSTGVMQGKDAISRAVAKVLYGNALIGTVTRLEQYAKCAFRYYLEYGLSLKERELFKFDNKDMGTVFHASLEKYASLLNESGLKWTEVDDEQRTELVRRSVQLSVDDEIGSVLNTTFRNKYMVERITKIVDKSVEVMVRQLKKGEFVPKGYEIKFSSTDNIDAFTFKLSDDELLKLSGKVDRLDTCETDEKIYIKIIDYKSGDLKLDLMQVYKGVQLQLVCYMNACRELVSRETDKEIVPAGILYYHLDYPVIKGSIFTDENTIADAVAKEMKMKGLVNSEEEVYSLIDRDFSGYSDVIPVKKNTGGELSKDSSAVSTDDFKLISDYVNMKVCDMGREILSGNIKAGTNIKNKDKDCEYCPYNGICRLYLFNIDADDDDSDDENSDFKLLGIKEADIPDDGKGKKKISKENILDAMRRETGNG